MEVYTMKIAVCGKGGSGKSTVLTLITKSLLNTGKKVVVLDSDESNSSLYWMLGFDSLPLPLMDSLGGKKKVQKKLIERFKDGFKEPEISIWMEDEITYKSLMPKFVLEKQGVKLIQTGKIHQALEGCACPMGVVTREFLKKYRLEPEEVMVIDMEAGIEHFGRGIEQSVDQVLSVIEPSLESISLAEKISELSRSVGACFKGGILNKIMSQDQESYLCSELQKREIPVLGVIHYYPEIQSACLMGKNIHHEKALKESEYIIKKIISI